MRGAQKRERIAPPSQCRAQLQRPGSRVCMTKTLDKQQQIASLSGGLRALATTGAFLRAALGSLPAGGTGGRCFSQAGQGEGEASTSAERRLWLGSVKRDADLRPLPCCWTGLWVTPADFHLPGRSRLSLVQLPLQVTEPHLPMPPASKAWLGAKSTGFYPWLPQYEAWADGWPELN